MKPFVLSAEDLWSKFGFAEGMPYESDGDPHDPADDDLPDPVYDRIHDLDFGDRDRLIVHLVRTHLLPEIGRVTGTVPDVVVIGSSHNPIRDARFGRSDDRHPDGWEDIEVEVTEAQTVAAMDELGLTPEAQVVHVKEDVSYMPTPNTVEIVLSAVEAPAAITKSAFMMPVTADGQLVLATIRRRDVEAPGGHIDPGETAMQAAIRECHEETGCRVTRVIPIGYLRMHVAADKPEGYRYPHPDSFQQFYAGVVETQEPYVANDECLEPVGLTRREVTRHANPTIVRFGLEALIRMAPHIA